MKLMTKAITNSIPPLRGQEEVEDPIIYLKLFCPWSNWTWYATEFDPKREVFFGLVHGQEKEWGYFSLKEMSEIVGPGGLGIERDLYFGTKKVSEI